MMTKTMIYLNELICYTDDVHRGSDEAEIKVDGCGDLLSLHEFWI